MMEPWRQDMYRWRYTKGEAGARVEMCSGHWNYEALKAEVQAHDNIVCETPMRNKLKRSRVADHECHTNF